MGMRILGESPYIFFLYPIAHKHICVKIHTVDLVYNFRELERFQMYILLRVVQTFSAMTHNVNINVIMIELPIIV